MRESRAHERERERERERVKSDRKRGAEREEKEDTEKSGDDDEPRLSRMWHDVPFPATRVRETDWPAWLVAHVCVYIW
jgi:hypothetical protein